MKYMTDKGAWQETLNCIGRTAAVATGMAAGIGILAAIILWDADFYAVRARWENFKDAMFGPWHALGNDQKRSFEDAFKDMADFNFFQRVPIEGTSLAVMTGTSFPSSSDVLAGRPDRRWCYINVGTGNIATRIELAWQLNDAAPVFIPLPPIPSAVLAEAGIDATRLIALAKTHCRLGQTSKRTSPSPPSRSPT